MSLTAAGLAAAITASQGAAQNTTIQNDANLKLATAIVNYFKSNTIVAVTVTVDPGTHAGSGTGTIS